MKDKEKAYLTQRVIARVLDVFIVSFISLLIGLLISPLINGDALQKLNDQTNKVMDSYINHEIDFVTYTNQIQDISYEQTKLSGLSEITSIIIIILYFVVYQVYNGGQTIGRKIMKIKVVKTDDSDLQVNDMIIREIFNYSVIANILTLIIALFGKNTYFYGNSIVSGLQTLFMIVTIVMIVVRKDGRGLPDMLGKTEVINIGSKEVAK